MSTILITGFKGQFAYEFKNVAKKFPNSKFFFKDLDLDIIQNKKVKNFINEY